MQSIRELLATRHFDMLGNRTPAENAEHWKRQWEQGLGNVFPRGPGGNAAKLGQLRRARAEDLPQHLERAGVPERIAEALLTVEERPAIAQVKAWLDGPKSLVLLSGDAGRGKSVAAASMFRHAKRLVQWDGGAEETWDSSSCAFVTAEELASAGHFDDWARKTLVFLANARFVVLDDLGAELITDPWRATLDALVDARFRAKRKTAITTNVSTRRNKGTPSPFEQRYGARIARRIRESGEVIVVGEEAPSAP